MLLNSLLKVDLMSNEPRVYFDACCFIDMAQSAMSLQLETGRESHVFYCRKFLEAARNQEVFVFTSTVSVVECTSVKDRTKPSGQQGILTDDVKQLFRGMLLSARSGVMPVQPTPIIIEDARDLKWDDGATLRPMDAIHVATAIAMKCTHFVTTDNLHGADIVNNLGLAICRADDIAHLLPDRYKQLALTRSHEQTKQVPAQS